jgi:hypothetical protein
MAAFPAARTPRADGGPAMLARQGALTADA